MKSLDIFGNIITWSNLAKYCEKNSIETNHDSVVKYYFWLNRPSECTDIMVRYQCACGDLYVYQCNYLRKCKTGGFDVISETSRSFGWDDICMFVKENSKEQEND